MDYKTKLIEWARELKGLSRSELDRICGFSPGTISKLGKRYYVLSEENLDRVIGALGLHEVEGGGYRFNDGTFIKTKIKDRLLVWPDYEPIFTLMEMYRGIQSAIYIVNAMDINPVDRWAQRYFQGTPAFSYFVINVPTVDLIVYARRKNGFLINRRVLEDEMAQLGARVVGVEDRDISFSGATIGRIRDFIQRH
ncbi:MAG: helix-turn-helix transcriptional regulator [Thermodesulfovibrionales bacterium]|jgi:hypothetical protein